VTAGRRDADHAGARYAADSGRGHVESYFLKANDPAGTRALWLKATIFAAPGAPESAVAESWAVAFDRERGHVAVKSHVPLQRARFAPDDVNAEVSGCELRRDRARGELASDLGRIAWDLRLASRGAPLVHFPRAWMYDAPFPSTKLVSPVFDGRVAGTVSVGDRAPWSVEGWPALLGHNWGTGHTPHYAWAHCNAWDVDEDLVFEGLSGRIALGPLLAPPATMLFVRHRGVDYALNGARDWVKNRGLIGDRRWSFRGRRTAGPAAAEIEGELWADTDDFVGLYYPNPSGPMTYCLNTKLARARITLRLSGRPAITATSRAAALEIGTRDPGHGIRMYV